MAFPQLSLSVNISSENYAQFLCGQPQPLWVQWSRHGQKTLFLPVLLVSCLLGSVSPPPGWFLSIGGRCDINVGHTGSSQLALLCREVGGLWAHLWLRSYWSLLDNGGRRVFLRVRPLVSGLGYNGWTHTPWLAKIGPCGLSKKKEDMKLRRWRGEVGSRRA